MTTKVLTAQVPLPLAEKSARWLPVWSARAAWIVKQALIAWIAR